MSDHEKAFLVCENRCFVEGVPKDEIENTYAKKSEIITYNNATTSSAGLMSSSDKSKLNGVESGAQKNPTVKALIDIFYPLKTIYVTLNDSFDPNTAWAGTTWTKLESGRVLQTASSSQTGGTKIAAGLPNITASVNIDNDVYFPSGAFDKASYTNVHTFNNDDPYEWIYKELKFDASKSNSIYGNSSTVQPPAIAVYMWQRTA